MNDFKSRLKALTDRHEQLLTRPNIPCEGGNGIYTKYQNPISCSAS